MQCRDESDEQNCKLLVPQRGYNKVVPPMVEKKEERNHQQLSAMTHVCISDLPKIFRVFSFFTATF